MIDATGRPHRAYRIEVTQYATGVVLRIDDDDDPEYWQLVTLPVEELRRLLRLCELRASAPPEMDELFTAEVTRP